MRAKFVNENFYDDSYYTDFLINSLNEGLTVEKIRDAVSKIKDKKGAMLKLIKRFNGSKSFSVRKYLSSILIILFLANFVGRNSVFGDFSRASTEMASVKEINPEKIEKILKAYDFDQAVEKFDITNAHIEDSTKTMIKNHEKLRLAAYGIGDGKITVGYGHAYPEKKSPYNVGDKISKTQAEQLFNKDLKIAEEGVKRMLTQWTELGADIQVNQPMFDAMVSMGFNMGISALRQSEFSQILKTGDYLAAADKISSTRIGKKFPGLIKRRIEEQNLFSTYL